MTNVAVKTSGENKTAESQSPPTKRAEGSWPSLIGLRHEIDSLFDHFMRGFPGRGRSIDLPRWKFETPFGLSFGRGHRGKRPTKLQRSFRVSKWAISKYHYPAMC
jgi:hypothetical protein